jgi:hypothetical protein
VNILTRPSYLRSLKNFSETKVLEINTSIARLSESLGRPHLHTGLSIRKLRPSVFELRVGLETRVLFVRDSTDIVLVFAGNHTQVRGWLKENV